MTPCSSGNSPTMAVARSHLPSVGGTLGCLRRSAPMRAAIPPARRAHAVRLASSEPSCAWNVTLSSAASRARRAAAADPAPRRTAASASRGRTTRSLPARTSVGLGTFDVADRDEPRQQHAVRRARVQSIADDPAVSRSAPRAAARGSAHRTDPRSPPAIPPGPSLHRAARRRRSARPPARLGQRLDLAAYLRAPLREVREHLAARARARLA